MILTRVALLLALASAPAVLVAQEPRPADVSSIDGIIRAYYEVVSGPAGAAPDVQRDRSLHHPKAWVAIAGATLFNDGRRWWIMGWMFDATAR